MLLTLASARRSTTTSNPRRPLAAFLALALALVGLVALPVTTADADVVSDLATQIDGPSPILAGEDASFTVTTSNNGAARFNLGLAVLVPVGLFPDSASLGHGVPLGAPRVVAAGTVAPGEPPTGFELWVWEDVSDIPAGAVVSLEVAVTPDPSVFPVGSVIDLEVAAHSSTDPRYRPVFPGSTGVGGGAAEAATESSPAAATEIAVSALRLEKDQLTYPENELLRGVHEQGAVYRLRVTNTNQGPTQNHDIANLEVVDWLPAGLEFLGCGGAGIDSSTHDWSGVDGGDALEYAGAGTLGA